MPLPDVPVGIAAEADDDLAHLRAQLAAVQASVLTAEGRYLQALAQPFLLPAEGGEGATSSDATRPPHRAQSLADLGVTVRRAASRVQTEIHEYAGPLGKGWLFVQRVRAGGLTWTRLVHETGMETWRTQDWISST